jgi:hypothetical protein
MPEHLHTYTIPHVAPSLNVWMRLHWSARERMRRDFQRDLYFLLMEKGNRCPRYERITVRSVLTFSTTRRRDSDNYGAVLAKWAGDTLVEAGVIPDDDHTRCTFVAPKIIAGETEQTFLSVEGSIDGA